MWATKRTAQALQGLCIYLHHLEKALSKVIADTELELNLITMRGDNLMQQDVGLGPVEETDMGGRTGDRPVAWNGDPQFWPFTNPLLLLSRCRFKEKIAAVAVPESHSECTTLQVPVLLSGISPLFTIDPATFSLEKLFIHT